MTATTVVKKAVVAVAVAVAVMKEEDEDEEIMGDLAEFATNHHRIHYL